MKPKERRGRILELLHQTVRVTVDELSESLDTSRETVRRDLALLSQQGLLRKIHGGATAAQTAQSAQESPLGGAQGQRAGRENPDWQGRGQAFQGGGTVFSSTVEQRQSSLPEQLSNQLAPSPSLQMPRWWRKRCGIRQTGGKSICSEGSYFGDAFETVGPQLIEQIQKVYADHAILAVGGISDAGTFMDFSVDEAYVARTMVKGARTVTVLADSSKLHRNALFHVCGPEKIDRLITDKQPDAVLDSLLKLAGVRSSSPGMKRMMIDC